MLRQSYQNFDVDSVAPPPLYLVTGRFVALDVDMAVRGPKTRSYLVQVLKQAIFGNGPRLWQYRVEVLKPAIFRRGPKTGRIWMWT